MTVDILFTIAITFLCFDTNTVLSATESALKIFYATLPLKMTDLETLAATDSSTSFIAYSQS